MKTLVKIATVLALLFAGMAWPVAWLVDQNAGRDLLVVTAHEGGMETIEQNRELYAIDPEIFEAPVNLYGVPTGKETRLVFVDEAAVMTLEEDPDTTIYLQQGDASPMQAKFLYFVAGRMGIGALIAGIVGLIVLAFLRKSAPASGPDPAAV